MRAQRRDRSQGKLLARREAYRSYRATYDIAGHFRREVLPLRQIIFDPSQLQANAMLIDVFSLLTEARQRIAANINASHSGRRARGCEWRHLAFSSCKRRDGEPIVNEG